MYILYGINVYTYQEYIGGDFVENEDRIPVASFDTFDQATAYIQKAKKCVPDYACPYREDTVLGGYRDSDIEELGEIPHCPEV